MNVQRLFDAIHNEPAQPTLLVAVLELERQGFQVTVANRFVGSGAVANAIETGELNKLRVGLGVAIEIENGDERQSFRLHFLDLDAVALTAFSSLPVIYDPAFTVSDFRSVD